MWITQKIGKLSQMFVSNNFDLFPKTVYPNITKFVRFLQIRKDQFYEFQKNFKRKS